MCFKVADRLGGGGGTGVVLSLTLPTPAERGQHPNLQHAPLIAPSCLPPPPPPAACQPAEKISQTDVQIYLVSKQLAETEKELQATESRLTLEEIKKEKVQALWAGCSAVFPWERDEGSWDAFPPRSACACVCL
jgi:hypothetical protein